MVRHVIAQFRTNVVAAGPLLMGELDGDVRSLYRLSRSNMLLVGSAERVDALIVAVTGVTADVMPVWHPDDAEVAPEAVPETVLVRDVQVMNAAQQLRLYQSIGRWMGQVRVIATAPAPLYPLVVRQHFHEGLYYRLNMLCIEPVRSPHALAERS